MNQSIKLFFNLDVSSCSFGTHAWNVYAQRTRLLHRGAIQHVKLVRVLIPEPIYVVRRRADESLNEAVHI